MKLFKYLTMLSAAAVMMTACEVEPENLFSSDPVAPVLTARNAILMTEETPDEDVTFAWSAARNMSGAVTYELFAAYGEDSFSLGETENLYLTFVKSDLRARLIGSLPSLPGNDTVGINFTVTANDGTVNIVSDPVSITCYMFGDYVAAELTAEVDAVVCSSDLLDETVELLSWAPARFEYLEAISYTLKAKLTTAADWYTVASGLSGTSYSPTVDALNDMATSVGCENSTADIEFVVEASSESVTTPIESNRVVISITTFSVDYPEYVYLAGNHQGWAPATAPKIKQSSNTKGLYEGFADLTSEGEETEFKFCIQPDWGGDFGGSDVKVTTDGSGNTIVAATVGAADNLKVPSGFYRVSLNYKRKNLTLVKVESVALVGDAVPATPGWETDKAVELAYDAEAGTFSHTLDLVSGAFKIIINRNWEYSIGEGGTYEGGNLSAGTAGNYKVVLDVNSYPFSVKLLNTAIPEKIMLVGDFNDLSWGDTRTTSPYLNGPKGDNSNNVFYGVASVYNWTWGCKLLYTVNNNEIWVGGTTSDTSSPYIYSSSDNNIEPVFGTYAVMANLAEGTTTFAEIHKVSLIGGITGDSSWSTDLYFTYNETSGVYEIKDAQLSAGEYKIRFNDGWDFPSAFNLGGSETDLNYQGDNLNFTDSGTYDVTLDFRYNLNNTITFVKK